MDGMMAAAVCGFALLSAAANVMMAAGKGRRSWLWGAVGLLLNLPAMAIVALLPPAAAHGAQPARGGERAPRVIAA
jgi:hypothetical protein